MLRLLLFTLFLALLAGMSAWLANNPGTLTLNWLGWRIDTSAAFLAALTALAGLTISIIFGMVGGLIRFPLLHRARKREKQYARGLSALTQSLVALADGNVADARKKLIGAQAHLGDAPITLLLSAQLSKLAGNEAETRETLEHMLSHKETRLIAARGLSEYHNRHEQAALALPHAEKAYQLNPRSVQALRTLVSVHLSLAQWQEAAMVIRKASHSIPRKEKRRLHAIVLYAQARALLRTNDAEGALVAAKQSIGQHPELIAADVIYAQAAGMLNQVGLGVRLLSQAWKDRPHPDLADALLALLQNVEPEERLKTVTRVIRTQMEHTESLLLKARAAMSARAWQEARAALKAAVLIRETARVCRLMAELEQLQYQDTEAAARWNLRASAAEAEAEWVCEACGQPSPAWTPHCQSCHAFDTMDWKSRPLRYAA